MAFIAYVPWVSGNSDFEILTVLNFVSLLFILQMFPNFFLVEAWIDSAKWGSQVKWINYMGQYLEYQ